MLFASLIFLLGFLPIAIATTVLAFQLFGARGAVAALSISSFVFYGWYYPPFVLVLALTIILNFQSAKVIHRKSSKTLTTVIVVANLGLLAWFKYAGFLGSTITTFTGAEISLPTMLLPLGISFFTFQQIAFLVDVYQAKAKPGAIMDYVLLIAFFPQLIAGPIVHHSQLIPQLSQSRFAAFKMEDVSSGVFLFAVGLAKKVLIADNLATGADVLFTAQDLGVTPTLAEAWIGVLSYTFQIYFDFSGYSDMALGLGLIFGLKLPVNFLSPYKSRNIIEFWRRWNITLSKFLRDYLYYPLGGNRKGQIRRYTNLWIVMLLGGLWHGAGWQFVVWGGLHGFYLTVNHIWARGSPLCMPVAIGLPLTFLCVLIAWVFFRASNFDQAFEVLSAMIRFGESNAFALEIYNAKDWLISVLVVAILLVWFAPNSMELTERLNAGRISTFERIMTYRIAGILAAASVIVLYVKGSHEFIYFQF